jgi:serine/threonine-protein kinase
MFVCPRCAALGERAGACPRDGVTLVGTGGDALLGRMVGSYRVVGALAAGGMGKVYQAVHPEILNRVAIKVLRPDRASLTLVQRFFVEARAVARVGHPNIVRVIDLDSLDDGSPFIVMELLDGETLGARLEQRGPLPLSELIDVGGALCDALAAAHAAGVIHRDIKPDNVFLTCEGTVKVLDFGIAKLQHDPQAGVPLTVTGAVLGTPAYMAPEQVAAVGVDARADVYAVGALLYAAATGRPPFVADSKTAVMEQHLHAEPASPRALRPELPPALERAILRALAKRVADRPASAAELAAELRASLPAPSTTIAPVPTLPGSPPPRVALQAAPPLPPQPRRATRRWPMLAAAAVISSVTVAAAALLGWPDPPASSSAPTVTERPPSANLPGPSARSAPSAAITPSAPAAPSTSARSRTRFDPGLAVDAVRLDVDAFLDRSLAVARKRLGGDDVGVARFSAHQVDADGTLVPGNTFGALHIVMRRGSGCVNLSVDSGVVNADEMTCAEGTPPGAMPRCPVAQVVARALDKRGQRGRANAVYVSRDERWTVSFASGVRTASIPDDCPPRAR